MILIFAVLAGALAALLRAGLTSRPLESPPLESAWLVALAYLPQWLAFYNSTTGQLLPVSLAAVSLVLSQLLLLYFAWRNRRLSGLWLLGIGVAMNLAVIAANGGLMPIFPEVVSQLAPHAEGTWQVGERLWLSKDIVLTPAQAHLPWLSDRFLLPEWAPFGSAFSLGDVAIALGAFELLWSMSSSKNPINSDTTVGQQAQATI